MVAIDSVGGHHRDLITIAAPLIGAACIGTGLLAWLRRPENRFGALMVAVGFSYCLSGLIVTTEPWPFIAGLHLIAVPYAILYHVLLAFPSGRLETRRDCALVAGSYLTATVGWWVCMLVQDTERLGLPANPLLIADRPGLFSTLARLRLGVVVVLIALLGLVLIRRWRKSSPAQRRALAPVYLSGGAVLALYAVWSVLGIAQVAPDLQDTLERARVIALAVVPFAFLAGLLRSRVAAGAAVSELIARLGAGPRRGALRDALADALGDPSLQVAYWLPERQEWVDAAGDPFPLPAEDPSRTCTAVEQGGEPVAMLVHAASVADEPQLVRAVGGAAALALENERLDAELRANVQELRASRARVVESADAARRRIERDLHDGAQQQLVALASPCGRRVRAWTATRERRASCSTPPRRTSRRRSATCASWPAESTRRSSRTGAWDRRSRRSRNGSHSRWRSPPPAAASRPRSRRRPTSSSPRRSPTSCATPTPPTPGCSLRACAGRSSSRSPTTASAAPTRPRAPGCAASGIASRHWTGGSRSTRRPAAARPSTPSSRVARTRHRDRRPPTSKLATPPASPRCRAGSRRLGHRHAAGLDPRSRRRREGLASGLDAREVVGDDEQRTDARPREPGP